MKYHLTYEITTEESAEQGDFANHGFVTRNLTTPRKNNMPKKPAEFSLREAIDFLLSRESEGPVQADSCPISVQCPPRWFSYGGKLDFELNGWVTVSLHLPDKVTPSSAIRIARLLRCYGLRKSGGAQ